MENLEDLREVLEGNKDLARIQNLIELYSHCVKDNHSDRIEFTELVEKALIESLELKSTGLNE